MKYKMLVTDLDGTLLKNDKTISDYTYNTLKKLHDMGVEIVACSGRSYLAMPEIIRNLDFVNYYIGCNGANVIDQKNNKAILKNEIRNEVAMDILRYVEPMDIYTDCSVNDNAYVERYKFEHLRDYLQDEYLIYSISRSRKPYDNVMSIKDNFQKLEFFIEDDVERKALQDKLVGLHPDEVEAIISYKINFEIGPKGVNKGTAVQFLCDYLNIKHDELIVCGDNPNDIPSLSLAALKIVTSNGDEQVKAIADYVTDSCDDDGIAKAIDKLIFNN